ncbi:MAG: cytochrome c peroxidase [Sandaracinus sp.]
MRSRRAFVLLAATMTFGCAPSSTDAPDASPSEDVAIAPDAPPDAGCTALPGDLPGERRVAAGALLPNLSFTTATGSFSLADRHVPCALRAELIVIRVFAAWSGRSGWHAGHTARLTTHPARARFSLVDLLVQGPDALPARVEDLAPFAARYDAAPDVLAIDPAETFGALPIAGDPLPEVVLVDARDLRVVRLVSVPRASDVEDAIDGALARLDGIAAPAPRERVLADGRFTEDEWDLILGMAYPAAPPADPSSAHAGDPAAVALGRALFEDAALSPAGIGCASCHDPARGFGDGLEVGQGTAELARNTPTLYASALVRWPFWDGRVDSLWAQALGPIENAREMASSRLHVAHRIDLAHRTAFEAVFGPMPDLSDTARFPAEGMPGDAAWEVMASADRDAIDRVFASAGKAIAAYERTLAPPHTRFDDYLAGDLEALTSAERDGLHEYAADGCLDCHFGPALSNGAFHAIGMPGHGSGAELDVGRSAALAPLTSSAFRRQGAYSDAPGEPDPLAGIASFPPSTIGAFRTPTLRALSATAPYGHAGTFATIREVVVHYANVRRPNGTPDPRVAGTLDPHLVGFDEGQRVDAITAFLGTL